MLMFNNKAKLIMRKIYLILHILLSITLKGVDF